MTNEVNINAKQQALTELKNAWIDSSNLVSYQSNGLVLIIGSSITEVENIASQLSAKFKVHYLLETKSATDIELIYYGELISVSGYLGNFAIETKINKQTTTLTVGEKNTHFDIIINLTNKVAIAEVPPFGYYTLKNDNQNALVFDEINQLIGVLDKPKFFNLDTSICVHNRNKIQLCQRCIDACPADAIFSNGDFIDVNPRLCHGCGGCSSACPTGAISYAYPTLENLGENMHQIANAYKLAGGTQLQILFYVENDELLLPQLADNIIPLAVEEIGYLGLETFIYAFCLGIENVSVYYIEEPEKTLTALKKQLNLTHKILRSLGYEQSFVQLIKNSTLKPSSNIKPLVTKHVELINLFNKRNRIFEMVNFLYHNNQQEKDSQLQCDFSTTDDAYFGTVIVNKTLCTLCMACTSVCPPDALSSGNLDKPIINFQENLCVQCGLCAKSCPEDAITLESRLIFDTEQRNNKVILNEDKPFKCVDCGKVFGSTKIIEKIMEKLKEHSMFTDGKLANLEKCEDCRVKALF